MSDRRRFTLLGIPIDVVNLAGAVERIAALLADGGTHQVVTVNPEFLVAARNRPAFATVLRGAALATPDGIGVVLAARLRGVRLRSRVTGSDLLPLLARRGAAEGWRFFLLGAAPGVAEQAATALQTVAPGLRIAGAWAGSPRPEDEPGILERLRAARPDILLVAYGAPAQDLWLARNLPRTTARIGIGVGGTFDFLAGVKPRAPRLLRRAGLEWLYRLWREPSRAGRILAAVPVFALLVAHNYLAYCVLRATGAGDGD